MIVLRLTRRGNAAAELRARWTRVEASVRSLLEKIGLWGVHEIEQNIMDQTMADGMPMPPLKGARWRTARNDYNPSPESFVEFDTGELFRTLWYAIVGSNLVSVGSPLDYARWQDRGTSKRGTGRPGETTTPGLEARQFIGFRDARTDALREIAQEHVAAVWEGAAAA